MAEYIERNRLLKIISHKPSSPTTDREDRLINAFISTVKNFPAADVRPVVRGKWIQTTQLLGWRDEECAVCSVCGEDFVLDEWAMDEFTNLMNFCPNCGADMREES